MRDFTNITFNVPRETKSKPPLLKGGGPRSGRGIHFTFPGLISLPSVKIKAYKARQPDALRRIYPLQGGGYHSCGAQNILRHIASNILTAAPKTARFIVHRTRSQTLFHVKQKHKRPPHGGPLCFFQGNVFLAKQSLLFYITVGADAKHTGAAPKLLFGFSKSLFLRYRN